MDEALLRERVCRGVKQLWSRGMLVGADGLVCAEIHRKRYLVTPPGLRRADTEPNDLICVDIGGENINHGAGVPLEQWRLHRNAFQAQDPAKNLNFGASVLVEPPHILALLEKQTGAGSLDLGFAHPIPIVDDDHDPSAQSHQGGAVDLLIRGKGLFIAGADLASVLNRIERLEAAAAVRLAGGALTGTTSQPV